MSAAAALAEGARSPALRPAPARPSCSTSTARSRRSSATPTTRPSPRPRARPAHRRRQALRRRRVHQQAGAIDDRAPDGLAGLDRLRGQPRLRAAGRPAPPRSRSTPRSRATTSARCATSRPPPTPREVQRLRVRRARTSRAIMGVPLARCAGRGRRRAGGGARGSPERAEAEGLWRCTGAARCSRCARRSEINKGRGSVRLCSRAMTSPPLLYVGDEHDRPRRVRGAARPRRGRASSVRRSVSAFARRRGRPALECRVPHSEKPLASSKRPPNRTKNNDLLRRGQNGFAPSRSSKRVGAIDAGTGAVAVIGKLTPHPTRGPQCR